jgi:hypothetical protein
MLYVLHDMTQPRMRRFVDFAEFEFRDAFKAFLLNLRARHECALWYGSDEHGWKRLYATPQYPHALSRPWR